MTDAQTEIHEQIHQETAMPEGVETLADWAWEIECQVGRILNGPAVAVTPEEYDRARALLVMAESLVRTATEIATGEEWES